MFDFDIGKLLIFGIVALAVIPPKDLPRVMRTVGQTIGKMRRMAAEFQGQFMDAMKEIEVESIKQELETVKKDLAALEASTQIDSSFDPVMAMRQEITHAVEGPKEVGVSEVSLSEADGAVPEGVSEEAQPVIAPPHEELIAAAPEHGAAHAIDEALIAAPAPEEALVAASAHEEAASPVRHEATAVRGAAE